MQLMVIVFESDKTMIYSTNSFTKGFSIHKLHHLDIILGTYAYKSEQCDRSS